MKTNTGALGIIFEENVETPMRDGVVLRANVSRPDAPGKYPALLIRTPYRKRVEGYERYVRAGYVVMCQDSRGRYASDGDFVPLLEEQTPDGEDGYDTIEWLVEQPYCNGKVGTFGLSYQSWLQWKTAALRPPHLVAMCAYSVGLEKRSNDYTGSFRPARRVKWLLNTIAPDMRRRQGLPGPHTPEEADRIWQEIERSRWLGFMPWRDLPRYLPKGLAEPVERWLQHPGRRTYKLDEAHPEVEVPNLDFSGWYDHCAGSCSVADLPPEGAMFHLAGMQKNARTEAARTQSKLILGPWNHVGIGSRTCGDIDFGPRAEVDIIDVMIQWFDYWLKGRENGVDQWPSVRYFVMGSEKWRSADRWPPPDLSEQIYYLSSDGDADLPGGSGRLVNELPGEEIAARYIYDPRDPVATLWGPKFFTVPSDRRQLEYRRDILYYQTSPLEREVEVVGYPEVILYASSSAPDTDFFARLVDEQPDGPALDICYGMVRARHRHSLEREDFLTPGETTEFHILLGPTACTFARGHRIRLEVTSSDFPNHDRNHNTGRDDLSDCELVAADQTVRHGRIYPSRLILPGHR